MNPTILKSILNYETIDLLRDKVFFGKATVKDFEVIEELLEAFGKPRNKLLTQFQPYGIYSYEEYVTEQKELSLPGGVFGRLTGTILVYLDAMADYFIQKENLKPEIWELKNPETP